MIRFVCFFPLALFVLFAVQSCSNHQEPSDLRGLANLTLDGIGRQEEGSPPVARLNGFMAVSPQLVATTSTPVVGVVVESQDAQALLTPSGQSGTHVTWLSADRVSFTFIGGTVLARTSGLGNDLQNTDLTQLFSVVASGKRGVVQREHVYLTRDFQQERQIFTCDVIPMGNAKIVIADRMLSTLKFEESCRNAHNSFTNTYWLDHESGVFVQSIQWVHPMTGRAYFQVIGN